MNKKLLAASLLALSATTANAQWASVEDSPYTYRNSQYNYDNSPNNYRNSPYNYENSQYNPNAKGAIYDEHGRRSGYAVDNGNGVVNIYDNRGRRMGYATK